MRHPTPTAEQYIETAMVHLQSGRVPEAALGFQYALMLKPTLHEQWNNRGICLAKLGNHFDAILNYRTALDLCPDHTAYLNNMGVAYMDMHRPEFAQPIFDKVLSFDPEMAQAHQNLGNIFRGQQRFADAIVSYDKALAKLPDSAEIHLLRSFCNLELGNFTEGWAEYEWRWKSGQIFPRGLKYPEWAGENLNGKRIILYAEQGFGDALQFCRYVDVIRYHWPQAHIILEGRLPLKRICETLYGLDEFLIYGDPVPPADYQAALCSCPRILGTTLDTIYAPAAYLHADPHHQMEWRRRIDEDLGRWKDHLRVGVCWAGLHRAMQPGAAAINERRSTALVQWHEPAKVQGVFWFSLQKDGAAVDQVRNPPVGMTIADYSNPVDGGLYIDDFADTAALIANLDLVISVDTAVAHLAAAMGKPTWVLSRWDSCWRWMGDKPYSPWYPTVRHFRQPGPGDWDSLLRRVRGELETLVKARAWAAQAMTHVNAAE